MNYAELMDGEWRLSRRPNWTWDGGVPLTDAELAEQGWYPVRREYPEHDRNFSIAQSSQADWELVDDVLVIPHIAVPRDPEDVAREIEEEAVETAREKAGDIARLQAVEAVIDELPDEDVEVLKYIYPEWVPDGRLLKVGAKVRRNGVLYRVDVEHNTQETWPPEDAVSVFTRYRNPADGPQPWEQPLPGVREPYATGEEVTHDNPNDGGAIWLYRSKIDANTTQPGRDAAFDRWWEPVAPA